MKRYVIDLDMSKCVSCGACTVACMDQNDFVVQDGRRPRRNIFDMEQLEDGKVCFHHLSLGCMHCTDAPCIVGCPSACLRKDPETGMTIYDTTNCIGCHSCAMACPYGVPAFGADGKMTKCDGCYLRIQHGMLPACVKACPFGALQLVDLDDPQQAIPAQHSLRQSSLELLKAQV